MARRQSLSAWFLRAHVFIPHFIVNLCVSDAVAGPVVDGSYQSIQPPYDPSESLGITIMTERFLREAHAKNIKVEPWTVNDPELMKQYIEWGVDGIITDRPDLMVEILNN